MSGRLIVVLSVFAVACAALGAQRRCLHLDEQTRRAVVFSRVASAVKQIEQTRQSDFLGALYPHTTASQPVSRVPKYGEGEEAGEFLTYANPLQLGSNIQMQLADLHVCPEGQGECSYSGMIELRVDNGPQIVIDVFGIGTNDANWFSVRNGVDVMDDVVAAIGQYSPNSNPPLLAPLTQEDFQDAILQCWMNRYSDKPDAGETLSRRERALRHFGNSILHAICHEWQDKTPSGIAAS